MSGLRYCLFVAPLCASMYASVIGPSAFAGGDTLIDFDNLAGGNCNRCGPSLTDQYMPLGVTFVNPSYPGQENIDSNLTGLIADSTSPNALFVFQGGHLEDLAALPFEILFSIPVNQIGFNFGSSLNAYLRVEAYDASGKLLETQNFVGNSAPIGLSGFAGLEETVPVARLELSYHPNDDPSRTMNFSIDNLRFRETALPEPCTQATTALALAAAWLAHRRRRNRVPR